MSFPVDDWKRDRKRGKGASPVANIEASAPSCFPSMTGNEFFFPFRPLPREYNTDNGPPFLSHSFADLAELSFSTGVKPVYRVPSR